MPASAGLFGLVCAGCVWFGVGWDSLVGSFICSIPSGGCSLVCGDARSPAGRSGFLLFVVLLDGERHVDGEECGNHEYLPDGLEPPFHDSVTAFREVSSRSRARSMKPSRQPRISPA